ncbi:hypothetical protein GGS23DRAFT_293345 [Durotheca rogersii]|uniref:uncharacterized protein n=1 Tax=Durotheca rogersii TaxID=419775 RepID=UPI00221F14ED|nr:uncharacterized protein GGS23DRAFT_293345 [Durotheca rogersii]KAI5866878.1 hypothetical protein GGS23DRAFT_293345 [Durotheca rogersii]
MSPPPAASVLAMAATNETCDSRLSVSSQGSNPDASALSFESSFRLESGYPTYDTATEKHPKGKRKRTTTQDKAILEAAYNANAKPDKAARLDIVSRVSLNEKEVQIWFQNRRQNDRRKSRPLTPQEIAALRYGGNVQILSAESTSTSIVAPNSPEQLGIACVGDERGPDAENLLAGPHDIPPQRSLQSSPRPGDVEHGVAEKVAKPDAGRPEVGTPPSRKSEPEGRMFSQTSPAPATYLANRRSLASSFSTPSTLGQRGDDSLRVESFSSSLSSTRSSPASILPPLSSSSSKIRLSLSLEGKAELVSAQPSPPRPTRSQLPADTDTLPPVRISRTLHRSRSALSGVTLPPISTLTAHLPPQLSRGRSRDVHAWESCCEADTRDELTKQAENESSGSALAAISLLRSSSSSASLSNLIHGQSSTNVLQSNPGKRNAPSNKSSQRGVTKKPKLARASSSVARMQNLPPVSLLDKRAGEGPVEGLGAEKKPAKGGISIIPSPLGGDSDKENWSPDEEGNTHRRRPLPSPKMPPQVLEGKSNPRRIGRIFGEQGGLGKRPLFGTRANTAPVPRQMRDLMIFEDKETIKSGKSDEEVERFMRGEVSPSKRGDMDCVAGLLSLSQGNWR